MKKALKTLISCITVISAASAAPSYSAEHVMKISAPVPPTLKDVTYAWMANFEERVEKATNGRVDVQLYPANQLGHIPATVEGVAMGTIEMTLPIIGFLSALEPRFSVLDAAGLFDNERHAMRTLNDPDIRKMMAEFGADARVEPLITIVSGQGAVASKQVIKSQADLAGIKLRTGGATPLINEPLKAAGASPVNLPLGEVLPALQTNVIDASFASMAVLNSFKFQDVANQATYLPGSYIIVSGLVNKDFLAMLGPELEGIVRNEAQAALAVFDRYVEKGPSGLAAAWQKGGGSLNHFSDADAKAYLATVKPVVESIVNSDSQLKKDYARLQQAAARQR